MFIGHYAAAIGISSYVNTQKGALTFFCLASVLPDILMLSAQPFGLKFNFHMDLGLVACALIIIVHGKTIGGNRKLLALGFLALALHIVTDIPYMAQDSSNFYNQRSMDFVVEAGLLLLAGAFYLWRNESAKYKKYSFILVLVLMTAMQASWNFIFY